MWIHFPMPVDALMAASLTASFSVGWPWQVRARVSATGLSGGGWCTTLVECLDRAKTVLGSSKTYPDVMVPYQDRGYFNTSVAYFSADPVVNPTMFNWNSVFLRYCDGASFAGQIDLDY